MNAQRQTLKRGGGVIMARLFVVVVHQQAAMTKGDVSRTVLLLSACVAKMTEKKTQRISMANISENAYGGKR